MCPLTNCIFIVPYHPQPGSLPTDNDKVTEGVLPKKPSEPPMQVNSDIPSFSFTTPAVGTYPLSLLLLRLLEYLLDDLLFLNQEGPSDSVLDAVCAAAATIRPRDALLRSADSCVFAGTEGLDAWELGTAVTALGRRAGLFDVQVS